MKNLKNKVMNALNVLDRYGVSESKQYEVLTKGVYFDFTYGDPDYGNQNRNLDVFKVVELLMTMERMGLNVNVQSVFYTPWSFEYPELVRQVADGVKKQPTRQRKFDPYADPM